MSAVDIDGRTRFLGMVCAALDGRDPRHYILAMDGEACVDAHNVLKTIDDMLKAQWVLTGSPDDKDIL